MRSALVAALAASLVLAPTASAAASANAASLSLAQAAPAARAGADLGETNAMEGDTWIWVGLGVVALIVFFVLIDDDDGPDSP